MEVPMMKMLCLAPVLLSLTACGSAGGTAKVKDDGPQGSFHGKLTKGDQVVDNHEVVVMTDGKGQPQVGLWELCNIDLVGTGPYTSAEGSACMVDLGDGKKKGHDVTAKATFDGSTWKVKATFDDGTVWTYEGSR
jgi:hypothetical protein